MFNLYFYFLFSFFMIFAPALSLIQGSPSVQIKKLEQAAEGGSLDAMYQLGIKYKDGIGVKKILIRPEIGLKRQGMKDM